MGHGLSIRGDSVYCPLPLSLDSYWNCEPNCVHCYLRRLNHVWGCDLRPTDPDETRKKLSSGMKNKNPKSPLSHALARKITLRLGNKTDPLQPAERTHGVTLRLMRVLIDLKWTFVIQTRFPGLLLSDKYVELVEFAQRYGLITIMPVISPGAERDWELLEGSKTDTISRRISVLKWANRRGVPYGVNGEPFIPGFHTVQEFESMMKRLKSAGLDRYNTYNFHFNAHVAKRMAEAGFDIEKIWYHNQDERWKPILLKLMELAKKYGIRLGCPDFVNTGRDHREPFNTCCGMDVPNPSTGNTHFWKRDLQEGNTRQQCWDCRWNGVGDEESAMGVVFGEASGEYYTLKDAGL